MSRAVALALALATTGCATYEGSRDTALVGGVTFTAGIGALYAANGFDSAAGAYTGLAVATASMMVMLGSAVGMGILPKRVELALQIAHELVVYAEAGRCETVAQRRGEVEALDALVYEVVLMEDPAIGKCFGQSSSMSSSPPPPADPERPDPASTSIVR